MNHLKESVTAVILSENRKNILLIKRRDVPVWVLPGGGVENGETIEGAVLREAREETGFNLEIIKKVGEYTPINRLTKFTHLYELKIIDGTATTGAETKDICFFDLTNLPKKIPPPYDEWIEDATKNHSKIIQRSLSSITYPRLIKNFFLHPILVIRFLLSKIGLRINS